VGILILPALSAPALKVHLQGDRLSVDARRDKLTDILAHFAHLGVAVKLDPSIDAYVSGTLEDEKLEEALDQLLVNFSYVVTWDVIRGPLGEIPKLAEIRVFKPDAGSGNLAPLPAFDGNLAITRAPGGGTPFVQDEILLSVRAGTKPEAFWRLLREIGGSVVDSIPQLGIYRVRVPPGTNISALVDLLRQRDMLANVEPNYAFRTPMPAVSTETLRPRDGTPPPTALAAGAPPVAVLDSGLLAVGGVDQFVVGTLDALNPARAPTDPSGHGTQMALIASGLVRPAGAPGDLDGAVPVLAIRAFDDKGYASNFSVMNSINYAHDKGARVLSMSWGTDTDSAFLRRAIAHAQRVGMVVVASAGNIPHGRPVYPAAYPGVLAVSAMNQDGSLWEKSNYGNMVFAAAPGKAEFPVGHQGPPGAYAGTSIGAPYVAREVSKYFARHPNATPAQATEAFRKSLTESGPAGRDPQYGHGAFDAQAVRMFRSF
jgi:hypothetical protein